MTLPIKDFIIQKLLEWDPNFDVGAGLPTTSLMIEPLSVILQPIVDEITVLQATGSILTILESSDPDSFPEDIVDALASNAFVERQLGYIGSTIERIRFFAPQAFSAQKGVLVFRGPSGQRYTNSEAVSVTKAEMSLNKDGSLYYTDIPLVALEEGSAFNVEAGTIITMEAEPVGVANVTNIYKIDQGRNRETNTELIDRIKVAVTVRALVTGRGIIVTLTENFTSIVEVLPVGMHEPEMMRDIVYNVHVGGNVDVYVRAAALASDYLDVMNLQLDVSRRLSGSSVVVCLDEAVLYDLVHQSIDRTNMVPTVTSASGLVFAEGPTADYVLNDMTGSISRVAGSSIFHMAATGGTIGPDPLGDPTKGKVLTKSGACGNVRPGMVVTVSAPPTVAGQYVVKMYDTNTITIYGEFPVVTATGVDFQVDDNLFVAYEYNPVSVDICAVLRAADRAGYTIQNVPLMLITSVEVLDPLSGEPTGVTLSGSGGYGFGGFGMGGFGVGSGPDYHLVVMDPWLRFSMSESNLVEFKQSDVGLSVRVSYLYASAVAAVQAFCDDRDNQSETASLLVKHFIPVFVETTKDIEYNIPAATQTSAISVDAMVAALTTVIDNTDEGKALELSDLVDEFYNNGAVWVSFDGLESLLGSIHHVDGAVEFVVPTVKGVMQIPDRVIPDPSTRPMSPRITRFVTRSLGLARSVI